MKRFFLWLFGLLGRGWRRPGEVPPPTITRDILVSRKVSEGDLLQFHGSRRIQPPTVIVIGVDFGTSCSRVVIRSPYKLRGRAIAVPFDDVGHSSRRYLVPTQIFVGRDDTVSLVPMPGWTRLQHLKIGLLDRFAQTGNQQNVITSRDPSACAAGYVALVLREARRWFLNTQSESYGDDDIGWELNLGMPSAGYDDSEIRREFEAIAEAAWLLSLEPRPLTLQDADNSLGPARSHRGRANIEAGVVPEVAAQVVGYAKSHHREEGLHVLVDLGASTLDICSFRLRSDAEGDAYPLLTANVKRLGLLELHHRRQIATQGRPPFDSVPEDIIIGLPDWRPEQFDDPDLRARLYECDRQFRTACVRVLSGAIRDLRRRRDRYSSRWEEGLPIFMCGGGAQSRVFSEFLRQANREATRYWNMKGLINRQMPLPGLLGGDGIMLTENTVLSRLSVAYGLSYDRINIGRIEPPGEVPDVPPPPPSGQPDDVFIGKEQV